MKAGHSIVVVLVVVLARVAATGDAGALGVEPPFDADYALVDLGVAADVPASYAGLLFAPGDPDTLWIGGGAGSANGAIYALGVVRDGDGSISGFSGPAVRAIATPLIDGGIDTGDGNVLFVSRVDNQIGQSVPGSGVLDKTVDLTPLGVAPSPGGLAFVPAGFPGAGSLKSLSWSGGEWNTLQYAPDGAGTFDITAATQTKTLPGGPETFAYVPAGSPQLADFAHVAVAEFTDANIVLYDIDTAGDPLPGTRRVLASGFAGAPEGLTFDPVTGDLVFSVFSLANPRIFAVRGFGETMVTDGCDGVDNDGDEEIDEDFVSEETTCGTGACESVGTAACVDGEIVDDCTPGEAAGAETCDNGIDDDCDGAIDLEDDDCVSGECVDADTDGYGQAGGSDCPAGNEVDCDDGDPASNPGGMDLPGNPADEDCSGDAACDPCRPWKNHGQYVSCVAHVVDDLVAGGVLSRPAGAGLVRDAARSDVGRRGYLPGFCAGEAAPLRRGSRALALSDR